MPLCFHTSSQWDEGPTARVREQHVLHDTFTSSAPAELDQGEQAYYRKDSVAVKEQVLLNPSVCCNKTKKLSEVM